MSIRQEPELGLHCCWQLIMMYCLLTAEKLMLQVKAQVAERVSDTLARASDLEAQLEQAHDASKQVALHLLPQNPTALALNQKHRLQNRGALMSESKAPSFSSATVVLQWPWC